MKRSRLSRKRIAFISIGLLVTGLVAFFCTFGSISVCNVCGATQTETDFQLPFIDVTYWSMKHVESTTLSRTVERLNLCPPHQHEFVFAHGGGNGVMCAIGQGRHFLGACQYDELSAFVADVAKYRSNSVAAEWLTESLDPDRSSRVMYIARSFPLTGFVDQDKFDGWWKENLFDITEMGPNSPVGNTKTSLP